MFEPPPFDCLDSGDSLSRFHHSSCVAPEWEREMAQEREGGPPKRADGAVLCCA